MIPSSCLFTSMFNVGRSLFSVLFCLSILTFGLTSLHAQQTPEPPPTLLEGDSGLRFEQALSGEKILQWLGRADRTYFIQASPDLLDWTWAPNIESGLDGPMSYEVDGPVAAGFFRLQYTDQTAGDPDSADFDGDGLTNTFEIIPRPRPGGVGGHTNLNPNIQTNPLRGDTDGDGLNDKWEEENGLDPTDNGTRNPNNGPNGDPDGDGSTNFAEQNAQTNPKNAGDYPPYMIIATQTAQGSGTFNGSEEFPSNCGYYQHSPWFDPIGVNYPQVSQDLSVSILEEYSNLRPFPALPTHSSVNPDGLVVVPIQSTSTLSHFTVNSSGSYCYGSMYRNRVWILAPERPQKIDRYFLKIIETATAANGQEPTTVIASEIVKFTTEPNKRYSNLCDVSALPVSALGTSVTTLTRLLPIEVIDTKNNPAAKLKVAKMIEFGVINANRTIIPDNDRDSFSIRIKDAALLGPISVKVGSADNPDTTYHDDPTEISLHADGNDLVSDSQLLVSDDEDDDVPFGSVTDDQPNDRTHKIQLGGNFVVSAVKVKTDPWMPIELKTPVKVVKTVQVNAVILYDKPIAQGGQLVVSDPKVRKYFKAVADRYAQVGVKIELTGVVPKEPPSGVDLNDAGNLKVRQAEGSPLSNEAKSLIEGAGTLDSSDIQIFFANRVTIPGDVEIRGCSLPLYTSEAVGNNYIYNAFIGMMDIDSDERGGIVVAHELGHLLTNAGHEPLQGSLPQLQLMIGGGTTVDGILSSKRFNLADEPKIQNDSHAQ